MNKKLMFTVFLWIAVWGIAHAQKPAETVAATLQKHDKAVHPLDDWMRDPYITLGPDGFYYLTCTQFTPESEGQKVPLYKSADLATWQFQGFVYSLRFESQYDKMVAVYEERHKATGRPDQLKLWAPELHFIHNRWVIVHTSSIGIGDFVVASPAQQPFPKPVTDWGMAFGRQHDPSLFMDTDSTMWITSKCAEITKIKSDLSGLDGKPIPIGPSNRKLGHEGTYIIQFQGKYILFGTAWSTDSLRKGTYNLYYCTADQVTGPYNERKFVGRFLGHGTPFMDKQGRWWCKAFYNANVPPLTAEEAQMQDLSGNAFTINKQGLKLVPIDMQMRNGDVVITTLDPDYRSPGREEKQSFKRPE